MLQVQSNKKNLIFQLLMIFLFFVLPDFVFALEIAEGPKTKNKSNGKSIRLKWPKLKISKETTFFVEPINADGTIDYVQALNNYRKPKGLKRENNIAVSLWKAFGPGDNDKRNLDLLYKELELTPLQEREDYFLSSNRFIDKQIRKAGNENAPEFEKTYRESLKKEFREFEQFPYKTINYPNVRKWYLLNEIPLNAIEQALEKTHFLQSVHRLDAIA